MKKLNVKQKKVFQLFLVIFAILFLSFSYKAVTHYNYFMTKITSLHNTISPDNPQTYKALTIKKFFITLKHVVKFEIQKKFTGSHLSDSKLDTFYLSINKSRLKALNADLPVSGKNYVKAFMKYNKNPEMFKVKVKYRGDMPNHWMFEKKSFRIKMKKSSTLDIARRFNLINIDTYKTTVDLVTYKIAKELGLISPDFYPVRVFLNGNYMGVYFYLDQTKEQLLRDHNRMPGSIYQETGIDHLKTGEAKYKNIDENGVGRLWSNELYWDKIASRNYEQKTNRTDIKYLMDAVNNFDDIEFYNFMNRYVNKDAYYKYFALDSLVGSAHHTYVHNHKVYFDPYMGQFEPIAWDVRYWSDDTKAKDTANYPFINRIKLNPIFEANRDKVAYNVLQKYSPKIISDKYKSETDHFLTDLQNDKLRRTHDSKISLDDIYYIAYSLRPFKKFIKSTEGLLKRRSDFLENIYNEVNAKFTVDGNKITFEVNGNNPIAIEREHLISALRTDAIYADKNLNGIFDDKQKLTDKMITLYPGRIVKKGNFFGGTGFSDKKLFGNTHITPHPERYTFFIKGEFKTPRTLTVSNFITDKKAVLNNKIIVAQTSKPSSIHPWKLATQTPNTVTYSGVVRLNKLIEYDETTTVIIKAGTKFIMGDKASLVSYGKVIAQGTKQKPITFNAKNKHWGALVIQGKGANGSQLRYVKFKNGSLLYHNLISYTAPFNIHAVDDFEVSNCTIERNHLGDDGMHVAYSKGNIKNSLFRNSRSDALDIDISTVHLTGNKFLNSGNDAIDSMTSDLRITKNIVRNALDKCISVGERSTGVYEDNILDKCKIGLELKDESVITVRSTTISNSKDKAIFINRKNNYYNNAGIIYDEGIKFIGNKKISKKGFKDNYIKVK